MQTDTSFLWCVRAGASGEAGDVFLKKRHLAIGWSDIGDLMALSPSPDAFKAAVASAYPEAKPGAVALYAGMLFKFVHVMKEGDLVLYRPKLGAEFHIGQVAGAYRHDPSLHPQYPNVRPVKWQKKFPVTRFSQGAINEANSVLTVFQVTRYAAEFVEALGGAPAPVEDEDKTVGLVYQQVEQDTRDFVLKRLEQEFTGSRAMEEFVAHLLTLIGYKTRLTARGADGGIDIIAHQDELGFVPPIVKVQVKGGRGSVGSPEVQALYGTVTNGEYGLLVCLGDYTKQAQSFADGKSNLRLLNGGQLVELILEHYEELDARYKAVIPLKRVFIPSGLEPEGAE